MSKPAPTSSMTRREALRHLAAGSAVASKPRALLADDPAPIRLGFSLYGMKTLPLAEALRTCARIGYADVELALNAGYPTEPRRFPPAARHAAREELAALKLGLPALMINISLTADAKSRAEALDLIGEAATLGRALAPAKPPLIETVLGGTPDTWEARKSEMAHHLHVWAEAATRARAELAIKAHVAGAVNSPERLLWLLDAVNAPVLHAAYDFSHFALRGIGMEESMRALLPRTRFIHVKDAVGDARKFEFRLPGEGTTDYVTFFTLLRKHGYHGPVCVEVSSQISSKPGYDPIVAATKCHAVLSRALVKAQRGSAG